MEPSVTRIQNFVDSIIERFLKDGQFDECDLTLRDLRRIKNSILPRLYSIFHGRIQYPDQEKKSNEGNSMNDKKTLAVAEH